MKNYVKPMVLANEELAEGVYTYSGCYTVKWRRTQTPETGRETYVFAFEDAVHNADHTREQQTITVTFSAAITEVVQCPGTFEHGLNTTVLVFTTYYHQNPTDNIGLANLEVKTAAADLNIVDVKIAD